MQNDLNRVDLNLLRAFDAIAEERSLTLAGQRLGLSQPAISYSLSRLRTLFGDPLFIRTKTGMQPTPTALELAKPIGRALQAVQDALRHAERFEAASSTRTFRISMSDIGEMVFLPPLCQRIHQAAPLLRLEINPLPVAQLEEALRTGQLDFAIGNLPALKPSTQHEALFHEDYVCMTLKRSGLPGGKILTLEAFLAFSHVLVTSAENGHRVVEDGLRSLGIRRRIALAIPHFSVVPQILKHTHFAVTLPLRVARLFNADKSFTVYRLPVAIPQVEVTLHWHDSFASDDGNRWLKQLLLQTLKES